MTNEIIKKMKEEFIPMYVEAKKKVIASNYGAKEMKVIDTTIPNKIAKAAKTFSKQLMLADVIVPWCDLYYEVYNECVREGNKLTGFELKF